MSKRKKIIIWTIFSEVLALVPLTLCILYLLTKGIVAYELNEAVTVILTLGGGLLAWYIHEGLFKERRKRVNETLKLMEE